MVAGQDPVGTPDMQMQAVIEELMRSLRRTDDLSDLIDYFTFLHQHPVNLNTAGREDLAKILFLSDFQITSLLEYRKDNGPFYSISELQLVYGFDREVIRKIRPYITLGSDVPRPVKERWRQEIIAGIQAVTEDEAGYYATPALPEESHYLGSRPAFRLRWQIHYGEKLIAGITADQDAGEPFFTSGNPCGIDFCSAYLQYQGKGVLRQVNAGRYALRFGQGLILWNGFPLNKGYGITTLSRRSPQVRFASSSSETGYLQGLATVLQVKKTTIIPFFSIQGLDAHPAMSAGEEGRTAYSRLLTAGLHRTTAEISDRHNLRETLGGLRISWQTETLRIGATALCSTFEHPLQPPEKPYNTFAFRGTANMNAGADYEWQIKNIALFGEGAVSSHGEPALLQGLRWYVSSQIIFSMLGRYYAPGYHAFYAHPFSETGLPDNEAGLYLGLTTRFIKHLTLSGYIDLYRFPWLRYHAAGPSEGTEAKVLLLWEPAGSFQANLQYMGESRMANDPGSQAPLPVLARQSRDHLRLQLRYTLPDGLEAASRVDISRFSRAGDTAPQHGFWISQDLRYAPSAIPLVVTGRFGLFDTRYSTRIYTYENDLLYAFSTPSFTGWGTRWYLMLKYPLFPRGTMALRVARTTWNDRDHTGEGASLIAAPHKTEIKAQVRIRL